MRREAIEADVAKDGVDVDDDAAMRVAGRAVPGVQAIPSLASAESAPLTTT